MADTSDIAMRSADESEADKARAAKAAEKAHRAKVRRLFWMTQARIWHWITGAATLIGMILFAFTGITLNHAADIEGKPSIVQVEAVMPPELLGTLEEGAAVLPGPVAAWLKEETGASVSRRAPEWSETDIYVGMPRPGGDAWVSIDRESGDVVFEDSDRGAIAWLNDLHKGRNTGTAWAWFLDIFSVAAILFCLTGLVLLWMHAPRRPTTWWIVGAGLTIPAIIAVFLVHV